MQPALTYFKLRAIASAIQAASGTPEVVNPSSHGWRLYNGSSGIDIEPVEDNPDSPYFEGPDFAPANETAFVEGEARLTPPQQPGDALLGVPEIDVVLRTAGMARMLDPLARTTRYTPISQGFEIATHHWEQSGLFKEIYDARTTIGDLVLEIGQRAKATGVRVQGYIDELEEDQLGDVTVSDSVGPVMSAVNSTQRLVINGGAPLPVWAKLHGIQLNAQLQSEEYTEHKETGFTDRTPVWRIRIAKTDLADFNPRDLRLSGAIVETATRLRGNDGRYVEFGTRGKIRDYSEVDIDGKFGFELTGPTRVDRVTGIDFYIEFGDETFHLNGTLPAGQEAVVYDAGDGLAVSGEFTGPVTYAVTTGALPDGLAIDSGTGAITGTPTTAGSNTFTVTATDASAPTPKTATKEFTVVISA